jgi:predicted nucleotidyltransferase
MKATRASIAEGATPKSRADFAVADRVAAVFAEHLEVVAIAVGGSVARGIADEYSDLDLYVYCREFPSAADRAALIGRLPAERWKSHTEHESSGLLVEAFLCEGAEVDLNLMLEKTTEACIRSVTQKLNLARNIQAFVGGFGDCVALYGHDRIESWRTSAAAYPEELAHKMVSAHLAIEPLWVPGLDGSRASDLLVLHEELSRVQQGILGVLLGLNHQYFPPRYKRFSRLMGSMSIQPDDVGQRMLETFSLEPVAAIDHLRQLVHETFDLVGTHMPALDVEAARRRFTLNPALAPPGDG